MNKFLGIVVLGLLLSGCETTSNTKTKELAETLADLRDKKLKAKEQCMKASKDKYDDAENILANYKICMVEKGYRPND